jgi:hypothetical protein
VAVLHLISIPKCKVVNEQVQVSVGNKKASCLLNERQEGKMLEAINAVPTKWGAATASRSNSPAAVEILPKSR